MYVETQNMSCNYGILMDARSWKDRILEGSMCIHQFSQHSFCFGEWMPWYENIEFVHVARLVDNTTSAHQLQHGLSSVHIMCPLWHTTTSSSCASLWQPHPDVPCHLSKDSFVEVMMWDDDGTVVLPAAVFRAVAVIIGAVLQSPSCCVCLCVCLWKASTLSITTH